MDLRCLFICLFSASISYSQLEKAPKAFTLDANPFYGSIILHNPDISHLITNHPAGLILSLNKKSFGYKEWEHQYNYPDTGFSFIYQDMHNATLGHNLGLYAHYNFYFFKRQMQFRIGQGIAYNTNPYDKNQNFRNNAYGSHLLSTTFLMLNYNKERVVKNLGFKIGLAVVHYSNANFKAPNTSTNTIGLNAGLIYNINSDDEISFIPKPPKEKFTENVRYNLAFRSGLNESDVIDSGQFPFYIFSAYADKRLSRKSAVQLGADVFFSNFLKELIRFQAIAFPETGVNENDDYKRVGIFVGHELFISKLSIVAQLGYYVYYPFDFEGQTYSRIGLKYYFGKKLFGALTLKSHAAKAEAVEFGIGWRL